MAAHFKFNLKFNFWSPQLFVHSLWRPITFIFIAPRKKDIGFVPGIWAS